jgi:hypothetical protein
VQFCLAETTAESPLLPIFPMRLASLLRYAWWLQDHGVSGGMGSIRNYTTAAVMWSQTSGHGDPRKDEEWIWKRFQRDAPKYIRVFNGSQAKLPVQPEYLRLITVHNDFNLREVDDVRELLAYSILIFTGIRVGHLLPKDTSAKAKQHLLDWNNVKFEPDFENANVVVFLLDSTKVRSVAKKDPWWTAVGTCDEVPMLCPVTLMKIWYNMTHSGTAEGNSQYLLATSRYGQPLSRAAFTRRFRARMTVIAPVLGLDSGAFDARKYSGISFRKGAFSALAPHVQPHMLMKSADHKSIKTTVQHYMSDTIQQRAGNTALISRGFAEARPTWAQAVRTESVWAQDVESIDNDSWMRQAYGKM